MIGSSPLFLHRQSRSSQFVDQRLQGFLRIPEQ